MRNPDDPRIARLMEPGHWAQDDNGTHVALPLAGPLDEAAVEEAAEAVAEGVASLTIITHEDAVRAAIIAYVRAVGGGE